MTDTIDFTLPNLGSGPNPFTMSELPAHVTFVVLFFQRDYYCTNCRKQVQNVAARIHEFRNRDAEVVSIVPEPEDRVEEWQTRYDLPFPLLADSDGRVSEQYDQPIRFGWLGNWSDFLGRMPEVVIVDRRPDPPTIRYVHQGRSTFDRPSIDELLAQIDEIREPNTSEKE